ncbi:MAG: cellulase family glycosylhydrolase [Cellvibrionaceae bacterium]|nr:cellulase family glycosylhydrolase [Cellvibrionaceae bacterium]
MKYRVTKPPLPYSLQYLLAVTALLLSNVGLAGFTTSGTQLLDDNGQPFVFRGVNHPHTWYNSRTPQALSDIASVGANSVRVVLSNGTHTTNWGRDSAAQVADIIAQCKQHQLICVLEVHDSTGHPESAESSHMRNAIDYWLDIAAVLRGEENYVLINLANEPFGNTASAADWVNAHTDGIQRLRAAGLEHTLVVDAGNWGQDWQNTMYDNAQAVIDSDPQNNLVFSVHMYEVYQNRARIENYVSGFLNRYNVPLIVGEFGADHQGNFVDADSIMAVAKQYNIGYLGWSWSGNGACCTALDMVNNFNVNSLSPWGQRIINGSNGIRETAAIASIYGAPGPSPTPIISPTPTPPPTPTAVPTIPPLPDDAINCVISRANVWNVGYQLDIKITNNSNATVNSWQVSLRFPEGANLTNSWNADISESGNDIVAGNVSWNGNLAPGANAIFGIMGEHDGSFVEPTCDVSSN